MSVNKVMLIGRLGADPEMRYSQDGKAITKFRMATDSGWGENKSTDWHNIVTFGKTAESCGKFLSKGRQVFIEGRVTYRKWEKDDGSSQWFTDIIANDVQFLGGRDGGGGGGGYGGGGGGGGGYGGGGGGNQGGGGGGNQGGGGGNQGGGGGGNQGGGGGGGQGGGGFDDGFSDSDIPF